LDLARDANPQTYGVGVKELWELPPGRIVPGEVILTLGYPLTSKEYGGAGIYGGQNNIVSLAFVTGLDYQDPRLDPQRVLQEFKRHPFIAKLLEGGKHDPLRRKIPALRRMVGASGFGWRWFHDHGDSAGFVNSARLKEFTLP